MYTTSIHDFKKEKVLGKGSFGSVYLVRRRQDNKIYALKTVILEKLNKKEQENSVNEVRILASINHPNVIGYKEAFWDDDKSALNIVMEYADDGDLHSKIEKMKKAGGYFKEPIIWSYAIQMIEGLKALHDKKIMHRDLKSANIFLVKDKHQCKLGDMNVSKVIKEKVLHTQTGTPYYASPEVWNDAPYSYKSDLWSIGCVIYELCELKPPFQGKDLDELYENVCRGQPQRINTAYSEDLWKMILMLLQVDVNKRVDCNKFLNSELIKKKMQEMKKDPNSGIEAFIYNKNKGNEDDYLLETIKFSDIKEIKAQLPTKKNYNSNILLWNKIKINKNNKLIKNKNISNNSGNNSNKEDEILSKKIKEKQIELEKVKNLLNKNNINIKNINVNNAIINNININNNSNKEKIKKKKLIKLNINHQEHIKLKPYKTEVYKKINNNNLTNNIINDNNKKSLLELDTNNTYNSGRKTNNSQNQEKLKKIDMNKLFLKKYANKINNQNTNINQIEDRCQTPMSNYTKIFNNKLSSIPRCDKRIISKRNIPFNSLTLIEKQKDNSKIKKEKEISRQQENEDLIEIKNRCNTIEINYNNNINNSYIYNKPNMIIKKNNSLNGNKLNTLTIDRPGSATSANKREPKIKMGPLYTPNILISNSFINEKNKNSGNLNLKNKIPKIIINSPVVINKRKMNQEKEGYNFLNKLNKYFSYNKVTNKNNENNALNNIPIKTDSNNNNIENKYMKKINIKSYKQKLKSLQNDNFYEKKEKYGKIYEREKKEKERQIKKTENEILSTNNSKEILKRIKPINIREGNQILNCYLSPKNNRSQIFNNFYSINLPAPVKVINVYKK